jgi:uncharacterized repeat protein (TIGR01451 family)
MIQSLRNLLLWTVRHGLVLLSALLAAGGAQAQVAYGISRTNVFVINQATGVATAPAVPGNFTAQVGYESSAMAVSPINGLLYVVERTTGTAPRLATWDPATGAAVTVATSAPITPDILRATFCPDGRFYVGGNGSTAGAGVEIYELNPRTGALIRTIVMLNVPTSGSGDMACVNNGDLYVLAANATANPYQLFRVNANALTTGGSFNATFIGALGVTNAAAPNGLVEVSNVVPGCASPCLLASGTNTAQVMYAIHTTTGAATVLTNASGAGLVDLSREFPRDVSVSKIVTPTLALQGRTVTYTLTASNSGPAVAGSVTIADSLNAAAINAGASNWTCSVLSPGAPTAVTTGCGALAGSGSINSYVNLSVNATVQYTIVAPLNSSFTGTLTNSVAATLTGTTVDVTPSNNTVTVTSTVTPATHLQITKTNAVGTVTAGQTTSYTITVANGGPADAPNTVVRDPAAPGLICTAVSCAVTAGTATCPAAPTIAALQGTGLVLPTFNANATVTFGVTCGVTATGQ